MAPLRSFLNINIHLIDAIRSRFSHTSSLLSCPMKFSVFIPNSSGNSLSVFPTLYFLSGLTCNEDNFIQKSCCLARASQLGFILICPDTSPRGDHLPVVEGINSWDFGVGAGFYVDADVNGKWKDFQMYSYITKELYELVNSFLPVDQAKVGIFGHSMGGHGALVLGLRNPDLFKSISAFAPICNPMNAPWGIKAFTNYLGPDKEAWKKYDATELLNSMIPNHAPILIDQGSEDKFLSEQLGTDKMKGRKDVKVMMREGFDHSYWFIQTFVDCHLDFHYENLTGNSR